MLVSQQRLVGLHPQNSLTTENGILRELDHLGNQLHKKDLVVDIKFYWHVNAMVCYNYFYSLYITLI